MFSWRRFALTKTFAFLFGAIVSAMATPGSAARVVPQAIAPAAPSVRAAWVEGQLMRWILSYGGAPDAGHIENQRSFLASLPSGTEVFDTPGVNFVDGGAMGGVENGVVVKTASGYDIYRNGQIEVRLSAGARVTYVPALYELCVKPGYHVPAAYADRLPDTVVP
jgi:hypothetical protein